MACNCDELKAAIQELINLNQSLVGKINTLEEEIASLVGKINTLEDEIARIKRQLEEGIDVDITDAIKQAFGL